MRSGHEIICGTVPTCFPGTGKPHAACVISGFRGEVDEKYVLLGYYAASSGNF